MFSGMWHCVQQTHILLFPKQHWFSCWRAFQIFSHQKGIFALHCTEKRFNALIFPKPECWIYWKLIKPSLAKVIIFWVNEDDVSDEYLCIAWVFSCSTRSVSQPSWAPTTMFYFSTDEKWQERVCHPISSTSGWNGRSTGN